MRRLCNICRMLAVLTVTAAAAQTTLARDPLGGFPYWYYPSYGVGRYHANARVVPYFALYPPVYYSHSVPRPYGFSPFALPPGVPPVEAIPAPELKAQEIVNPYYRPSEEDADLSEEPTRTAQLIINSHVRQADLADGRRFVGVD